MLLHEQMPSESDMHETILVWIFTPFSGSSETWTVLTIIALGNIVNLELTLKRT